MVQSAGIIAMKVTKMSEPTPESTFRFTYTYDESGKLISTTEDGIVTTFAYDKKGKRVAGSEESNASGGEDLTTKHDDEGIEEDNS